jgi:predicted N-formylglutamate amidohydrolase
MSARVPAYPDHLDPKERRIIDKLICDALDMGCTISVGNGDEYSVKLSTDYTEITREVAACDEMILRIRQGEKHAAFFFVHGNEPYHVLNDHTDNAFAHALWVGAEKVCAQIEDQMCGVSG